MHSTLQAGCPSPPCLFRTRQKHSQRQYAVKERANSRSSRRQQAPLPTSIGANAEAVQKAQLADASFQVHNVQWYPGHIARAERQLKEQLKMVDVVLEVRDARIPQSTCHPQVPLWVGSKPRLIVINRQDMISKADRTAWDQHFSVQAVAATAAAKAAADAAAQRKQQKLLQQQQQHLQEQATQVMSHDKYEPSNSSSASLLEHQVQQNHQHMQQQQQQQQELSPPSLPQQVFWTDGKTGAGVHALRRAALKISDYINEKRSRRGLAPRPVRACVIGFPNIGKSALINRLLGRRVVDSAAKPGVTRVLRWVRLGGELDLLDAPGIIPASFNNQTAAQRLAMCNDIGEASYVDSLMAAAMLIRIKQLPRSRGPLSRLQQRYKLDPLGCSAEDFVIHVAGELFGGDKEQAGVRLLSDFRNGTLGEFALELPANE